MASLRDFKKGSITYQALIEGEISVAHQYMPPSTNAPAFVISTPSRTAERDFSE
jgi:hypothetical protein